MSGAPGHFPQARLSRSNPAGAPSWETEAPENEIRCTPPDEPAALRSLPPLAYPGQSPVPLLSGLLQRCSLAAEERPGNHQLADLRRPVSYLPTQHVP